jgi:hypothetical protein
VARERLQRELAELRLDAFAGPLFAGDCAAAAAAFERLLDAVARGSRDLVLDCPVEMPRDCAVWSRLAALSFGREPSCLWNAGRMLLALGPLPERAPLYWVAKSRRHAQLCAVTAVDRREPARGAAVSGDWPILRVFAELARRRM